MKIVHITTVHHPFDNRIFIKECISMAEMGHSVVLIVPHSKDEVVQNVQIRALNKQKGRLLRMFQTSRQAYFKALQENADVYHFHDPELIPFALFLKRNGKKVIYDIHEDYYSSIKQKEYLTRPFRVILANLFSFFEKILTNGFTRILAEKYYQKNFPDGVVILNYPKRELLKIRQNESDSNMFQVIYTGNITRDRGAVEHAKIVNYLPDIQVYLVGYCSKALADNLFASVGKNKDRLHIHGINRFVPFQEIVNYYTMKNWTAGLALFPPSPHYVNKELTKLFEYMSVGIPIICSDFPVWKRLIENAGSGICVDSSDDKEVRNAIEYLNANKEEAQQMGSNGRASVEKFYKWENEALKLHQLYCEIAEESK